MTTVTWEDKWKVAPNGKMVSLEGLAFSLNCSCENTLTVHSCAGYEKKLFYHICEHEKDLHRNTWSWIGSRLHDKLLILEYTILQNLSR